MPTSIDPTSGVELTANPHYWSGRVPIKHISIRFFNDDTSMALAFRAGEIDVCIPQTGKAFATTSGAKVVNAPSDYVGGVSMNTRMAPWNDIHVRRAVAYALNSSAILKSTGDVGSVADTIISASQLRRLGTPAQINAILKSVPTYPYNLARARAEMAKSTHPHGFSATTDTSDFGYITQEAEVVAAELAKIGIKLKINVLSLAGWVAEYYGPRTFGFMVTSAITDGLDPNTEGRSALTTSGAQAGGYNLANYSQPSVDALFKQAGSAQNKAKRLALYGKALKIISRDVPYAGFFTTDVELALQPKYVWSGGGGFNEYFYTGPWALDIRPAS
jgi:peptide/nickel transport system substrate-binding protein